MKRPILSETCLHIAIAFVVAGTIMAVIELRETRRFRDLVSRDVFQALLGRIVPEEVFEEINVILHTDIVRRDCKYRIIFKKRYAEMAEGYFVIHREVEYTVENLLNRRTTFTIRSSHSEDLDLVAARWDRPFHSKLLIDNKEVQLKEGENLLSNGNFMQHKIRLGPGESRTVAFHGEEPSKISAARNSYLQATPVIGIEVEVLNEHGDEIGKPEISMNHPARDDARSTGVGGYRLDRAFLPGQGFQVVWKDVPHEATPAENS